jgi:thiol reductant ABC exporter CydD subunit
MVLSVFIGGLTAALVVTQAWLIAIVVSGAFIHHKGLAQLRVPVVALLLVVVGRGVLAFVSEAAASRASGAAKSQLRLALAEHLGATPTQVPSATPEGGDGKTGSVAVLATEGIDTLDAYFSRYMPQVFLAVIVPATVVAVIAGADLISAVIIAVTVPLIPVFMALVGSSTRHRTARRMRTLQRLASHFLDVVAGLPTSKVFGRTRAQAIAIKQVTDQYRRQTMSTLRVAFLSSLILELLATVSVALVAVAVGLRLLGGHLSFETALFVLVLAPEAYLPLRQLGQHYHASADGMAAAGRILDILEQPTAPRGTRLDVPDAGSSPLEVDNLAVVYPDRSRPALAGVSFVVQPGEVVALAGPSGCGKSTLLTAVLALVQPTEGAVRVAGVSLSDLDPDAWRAQVAWVPQHPHLFAASIAENIRMGRPGATDGEVWRALTDAGLDEVVARLPDGPGTMLGENGAGLSAGERQRVALARAFVRQAPLLVLDEPTAGLDGETEASVLTAVRHLVEGRTVLMAAHRPTLLALADHTVWLDTAQQGPDAVVVSA